MAKKIYIGRGAHVGAATPEDGFEPSVELTFAEFVSLLTTFTVSQSKTGPYICRAMGGDGRRSDANAQPFDWLPLDLDELLPQDVSTLTDWAQDSGLECILATTFSHTPEAPRFRLWVRCSRDFTNDEHLFLFKAFAAQGFFPFKLDVATAKPSQPIYLPRVLPERKSTAFARHYSGKKLDVDGMLAHMQKEMHERATRDKQSGKGTGVRQPGGVIDTFNNNFNLPALLEAHGYKRRTKSRYTAPGSKSGRAAVTLHEWGLISFHEPSHDPLSQRNDLNVPRVLDPFAVYAVLEHRNDFNEAFAAAASMLKAKGWEAAGEPVSDKPPPEYEILDGPGEIKKTMVYRPAIIERMLYSNTVTIAAGDSNSGKSTILIYQAFCIATGLPFAGHRTERGRVLWVAGEDSYNAKNRVLAMADEYGIPYADLQGKFFLLPQPIAVMQEDSMKAFHASIERRMQEGPISALYLDSKSIIWGGEKENDNSENAEFLKILAAELCMRYNCAVIVLHHLRKSANDDEEPSVRGASSLVNNAEQVWNFKARELAITMGHSKLRSAPWNEKRFMLKVIELDAAKHPEQRDNFGMMPTVSLPEPSNQFGVSTKKLSDDYEYADILRALSTLPQDGSRQNRPQVRILELMGKIGDGSSKLDKEKSRDWLRRKLVKMIEQKLIDKDHVVTKGGQDLLESMALEHSAPAQENVAEDAQPA